MLLKMLFWSNTVVGVLGTELGLTLAGEGSLGGGKTSIFFTFDLNLSGFARHSYTFCSSG
jgi:hypothetical protein